MKGLELKPTENAENAAKSAFDEEQDAFTKDLSSLVAGHYGPRCPDQEAGCIVCLAWDAVERLIDPLGTEFRNAENSPQPHPVGRFMVQLSAMDWAGLRAAFDRLEKLAASLPTASSWTVSDVDGSASASVRPLTTDH